jgi:hypothetical protein
MAEFAVAYKSGEANRLEALFAPGSRLYVTDSGGTQEYIGAAAAAHRLGEFKSDTRGHMGFDNAVVLREGAVAYVDAKLGGDKARVAAGAPARLTAELELRGEQWRVMQMHYIAE